jgi:glyoxylase-like metal-dependent hydrolase (beta-lactamase superfamily II)
MQEVLPSVYHWTARHPLIHSEVSSYWLDGSGVVFDPLEPPDIGLDWFAERPIGPTVVVLSNRHHLRHANRFAERFGCPVLCNRAGLHEFSDEQTAVEGFDIGQRLPGDVVAHEMGAICPDDTALYLRDARAILLADGVVRGGPSGGAGPLGWVPDSLMDDPPQTKAGLLASCRQLLADPQLHFDHLLLAHGGPVIGDGRQLLQDLVDSGGRTAFEM